MPDLNGVTENLIVPLVAREQRHYRQYSDSDYASILLHSQLGARPSCRGAAIARRERAFAIGSASPALSTVYARIAGGRTEDEIREIATEIAVETVVQYARIINNGRIALIPDEFDESSTSDSPHRGGTATTEVGRRLRPRKRFLSYRKAAGRLGFDAFRDHDMIGLEHMHFMAEMADGTRFTLRTAPLAVEPPQQASFVAILNELASRLETRGLTIGVKLLDRRWDDVASIALLQKQSSDWVVRGQGRGHITFRPLTRGARKALRNKIRGDQSWTRKELRQLCWADAKPAAGKSNVLLAAVDGRPFQTDELECTTVIIYKPRSNAHIKPTDLLNLNENMSTMFLLTNRPATAETAQWAYEQYAKRWDIEPDIKEHKSYVEPGSGPKIAMRVLKEQVALVLENLATFVHAVKGRRVGNLEFVRYVYNELLLAYVVYDALRNGWAPARLNPDPGPP
ncbi:MAG: hypothetical protein WC876_06275 [Candidatus Thermoplasmatota archaeon]|jgi:hypothetical protein